MDAPTQVDDRRERRELVERLAKFRDHWHTLRREHADLFRFRGDAKLANPAERALWFRVEDRIVDFFIEVEHLMKEIAGTDVDLSDLIDDGE